MFIFVNIISHYTIKVKVLFDYIQIDFMMFEKFIRIYEKTLFKNKNETSVYNIVQWLKGSIASAV